MSNLPTTILHPGTFEAAQGPWFDGAFDWSFTAGAFGESKITPMDFDGVIERKGNFLLFETKAIGVSIPKGQLYTFESAYRLGCFTIVFIEGKRHPEMAKTWCQPGFKSGAKMSRHMPASPDRLNKFSRDWYEYADAHPSKPVDVTFLNKRISQQDNSIIQAKIYLSSLVNCLGGKVFWQDEKQGCK